MMCAINLSSIHSQPAGTCSHLALYVSEVNGLGPDVQVHLLTPQLLALRQEGETGLGFLHALHVSILERECQQVLQADGG